MKLKKCDHSWCKLKKMEDTRTIDNFLKWVIFMLVIITNADLVKALPSYARQTEMSCAVCHYSFPELTYFGRQFKMTGYTLTGMQTIDAKQDSDRIIRLKLLSTLPISVMFQSSFTNIAKEVPGTQNNSMAFPQQISVFYATQVTPHIGTFIQMTYDGQSFGMDNTDIRYTNQAIIGSKSLLYGFTLNNNPSVQDIWNTTPAWRFPAASSSAALYPEKSTQIEKLGLQVAGLGAYTLINNLIFAEISDYRSVQQGFAQPPNGTNLMVIKGLAPYWRLALQHQFSDNYIEIGTFGMITNNFENGISGLMDKFIDLGMDCQYERILPFGALTLHASYINESENRGDSAGTQNYSFNSFNMNGNLYINNGLGATLGYFTTSGSSDLNVVSLNNLPNSDGFIFQIEYLPWYNTKFSLQYVMYNKFNGSTTNYDGTGRNALNNNTIYLLAWLNF